MVAVDPRQLWDLIYAQVGKPYSWGDEGPDKFDCSGLVEYIFSQVGAHVPRTARAQQAFCREIKGDQALLGDLAFWGRPAHHVGIITDRRSIFGVSTLMMVDAPDVGKKVEERGVFGATSYGRVPGVEVMGGVGHGKVDTTVPIVDAVADWGKAVVRFVDALLNPHTWLRVGEVALGLLLIAVGTAELTSAVPIASKVAKVLQ